MLNHRITRKQHPIGGIAVLDRQRKSLRKIRMVRRLSADLTPTVERDGEAALLQESLAAMLDHDGLAFSVDDCQLRSGVVLGSGRLCAGQERDRTCQAPPKVSNRQSAGRYATVTLCSESTQATRAPVALKWFNFNTNKRAGLPPLQVLEAWANEYRASKRLTSINSPYLVELIGAAIKPRPCLVLELADLGSLHTAQRRDSWTEDDSLSGC